MSEQAVFYIIKSNLFVVVAVVAVVVVSAPFILKFREKKSKKV
jgi:hypothetical protein